MPARFSVPEVSSCSSCSWIMSSDSGLVSAMRFASFDTCMRCHRRHTHAAEHLNSCILPVCIVHAVLQPALLSEGTTASAMW